MFLSANTPLLAIDIGSHSIKLMQLMGKRNKLELNALGVMPLDPESVIDGVVRDEAHVVDALTRLLKAEKIETPHVVSSVAGEAVIIKKISVPKMPQEELGEAVSHEAEQYIPFDIDDVKLDYQILEKSSDEITDELGFEESDEEKQDILLVAVQNEIIDTQTNVLTEAKLEPVIIDLDVFASTNALSLAKDLASMKSVSLIDLGATFTHINMISNGTTSFTRDIPHGGNECTEKLMSQFDVEQKVAEELKRGIFSEGIDKREVIETLVQSLEVIVEEIQKAFEFFSTTTNTQTERVFICGGGALIPGTDSLLNDRLGMPVEVFNPFETIKINSRKFDQDTIHQLAPLATVATGLATRRFDYS